MKKLFLLTVVSLIAANILAKDICFTCKNLPENTDIESIKFCQKYSDDNDLDLARNFALGQAETTCGIGNAEEIQ